MTENEKNDICYECRGYGDDYYMDGNGEMISACDECWINEEVGEDG